MAQNKVKQSKYRGTTPHTKDRARAQAGQIKLDKEAGQMPKKKSRIGVKAKKKF